jgi:ATP-binding cassette subfamily F protein 3
LFYAKSIDKSYAGVTVLESVSFIVGDGEHVGLVGPNGCGKSTLLRILARSETADEGDGAHRGGALGFLRQEAQLESSRPLEQEMWMAFPEARAIEVRLEEIAAEIERSEGDLDALIEEQAALFAEFERLDGYRIDKRIGRVLDGLGFTTADRRKLCGAFSGGWQMRVALAQVLVRQPEHMLLDEPTNHLDKSAREWLIEHLQAYKGTAIIVAHDGDFLDEVVERVIELREGRAEVYTGNYTSYQRQKAERLAQQESAAQRQSREIARQERFIERFRSKAKKARQVQSRIKMLDKVERIHTPRKQGEVHFQIATAGRTARAVLTVKHLSHAYEDEQIVLLDANLEIERGDKVVLVGPNGSGKSTLLRALAGTLEPTEGTIAWGERSEVGYYDQHQDEALDGSRTVIDELRSVAEWSSEQELRDALGRFLFRGDDVFKKVSVLSGGERSRVALAKFLIQPSNVLLLDEPTNHLDITTRRKLLEALVGYGGTIVCASHDPAILRQVATKAYAITDGQCERLMEWTAWEAAADRATR